MDAALIIAFFLLAAASFVIIRTRRSKPNEEAEPGYLPPPDARGLFDDRQKRTLTDGDYEEQEALARRASELRERAGRGDFEVLREADLQSRPDLYRELLDTLVANVDASPDSVGALASYVVRNEGLRAGKTLAASLLRHYDEAPSQISTTALLRVAALSDEASVYMDAIEAIIRSYHDGRLPKNYSAGDLVKLFESEYWLLAPEARTSGAGFMLKQQLADVRHRLNSTDSTWRESTSTKPEES